MPESRQSDPDRRRPFEVIDGGHANENWGDGHRGYDPKAEEAVISNILVDSRMVDEVRPFLRAEHFLANPLRRVYEAATELRDRGELADAVTISARLRDTGHLGEVGGNPGLTEMLHSAPGYGPTQVVAYARIVRDKWVRRQLSYDAKAVAAQCATDDGGIEQIVAEARARVDALSQTLIDSEKSAEVKRVLERAVLSMQAANRNQGKGSRPTGFDRIDRITAGLHSELVLIGARPGMGKTSLATAIAINRAVAGDGAYIASLETPDDGLMIRMICAEAMVSLQKTRLGLMTPTDWSRVTGVAARFSNLPIWVDDQSSMTVAELWAKARRINLQLAREDRRLGVVVVDYIQLLRPPRGGMAKREQEIAENARMLKAMASELDCTVLALSQLNRECEKRQDKRPTLSDLRESGELEQCARTVLLLYREDYYRHATDARAKTGDAEVMIAKQNNGPSGMMVKLRFDEEFIRFDNLPEGWE